MPKADFGILVSSVHFFGLLAAAEAVQMLARSRWRAFTFALCEQHLQGKHSVR